MKMNKAKITSQVSEMADQHPDNSKGYGCTLEQLDDSCQSAYEAGLAEGREAAFQQGYQAGFMDGCEQHFAKAPSKAAAKRPSAETRGSRLKGFPCAKCGCSSYSDETECPRCRAPKAVRGEEEPQLAAETCL